MNPLHTATEQREHLRLNILRLLCGAPQFRSNSLIIGREIENFGFGGTRDQVKSELIWLDEQGLVRLEELPTAFKTAELATVVVATLTERGYEVAEGRAVVPGVRRPIPHG